MTLIISVAILPLVIVPSINHPIIALPYAALLVYAVWKKSTKVAENV